MSRPSQMAAVPMWSAGLGLLMVGGVLAYCQLRLGFKNNAFAYGLAVSSSAKARGFALLRGNIGGMYFIGLHLVFGFIAFVLSLSLLGGVPQPSDSSGGTVDEEPSGPVQLPRE